jgi:Uma2 family endonuclease
MIAQTRSLLEQLRDTPGKAEIVAGKVVLMSPAGFRHNRKANRIVRSLEDHEAMHGGGAAFSDNLGFIVELPNRKSFSPDGGWLVDPPDDDDEDFVVGPPTFAVEIRSKNEYGPVAEESILAKIADYFAAGTLVVWDVDLKRGQWIRCYRSANPTGPQVYQRGDTADAEPAVSGWKFEVDELFR